jgi:uncharacterized membrane protein YkvA (DUF1232 family)
MPPGLPEGTRFVYQRYLRFDPVGKVALLQRIERYMGEIRETGAERQFLDISTAQRLALSLGKLIEVCGEDHLPHVQAAVYYFVNADDAQPDLQSMTGFDDDVEVANTVCRFVGHPELEIRL